MVNYACAFSQSESGKDFPNLLYSILAGVKTLLVEHKFQINIQIWTKQPFVNTLDFRAFFLGLDPLPTLGARDFSCAVSGFGQLLKSDPRERDNKVL